MTFCILEGGPIQTLDAGGKRFLFEFHPYCGPVVVNAKTHEPLSRQPGERNAFWVAVTQWAKQGKRVVDGVCVWEPEPEPEMVHLGGRHWMLKKPKAPDAA